ncbi:MAG TPA: hypothetical protein VM933_05490 [Acidimicrobiales bacterium]|nr:hypothetical protein [Acidimicrobiales bacterium]
MAADPSTSEAIAALSALALAVRDRFAQFEMREIGREWTTAEIMSGFVVDVGDLMRLVMAATGSRQISDVESKIGHELADCLWCVLVLADRLNIDLATAFEATMSDLTKFLERS